jgi:hypothetical protein
MATQRPKGEGMIFSTALFFLISASLTSPGHSLALLGSPNGRSNVAIWDSHGIEFTAPCDQLAGYVPQWNGVAAVADGELIYISTSGAKRVVSLSKLQSQQTSPNCAFAVSPRGSMLAQYNDDAAELSVWSLPIGKLIKRVGIRDLTGRRLQVMQAPSYNLGVVFDPDGKGVYATFPSKGRPDEGGLRPPVTVRIPIEGGTFAMIGRGTPVGFLNGHLVRSDWETVFLGSKVKKFRPGDRFSTDGSHFFVISTGDRGLIVKVYDARIASLAEQFRIRDLPKDFVLTGMVAMPNLTWRPSSADVHGPLTTSEMATPPQS